MMDEEKLPLEIQNALDEITQRKKHLLKQNQPEDDVSIKIVEEFIQCCNQGINIHKNLVSLLILISSHLINESINRIIRDLNLKNEDALILKLYMHMQMSSNFLDGFLLGHSFVKIDTGIDILNLKNINVLEVFKQTYLLRLHSIDKSFMSFSKTESRLVSHFETAYKELFLTNSMLFNQLSMGNAALVVQHLMSAFFDGIVTSRIIADTLHKKTDS